MHEQIIGFVETMEALPPVPDTVRLGELGIDKKIIVLDDDPTGIQTVNNISVYTDWTLDTVREAFRSEEKMFFILTNSRGLGSEESRRQHECIADNIARAVKETGQDFILISRSDSTLRGHYPLETATLRQRLERELPIRFDGEIICPFFCEGGRYTINDVHYVREGDALVPAGMTEFAKDKTFGYSSSSLREWCEEKTGGTFRAESVTSISLEMIRKADIAGITGKLVEAANFSKIIVNAADYADVRIFAEAYSEALKRGRRFMFRSAAAVPKILGDVKDRPLLTRQELVDPEYGNGGLVIVGSHVNKTTCQLSRLMELPGIAGIEFDQHRVLQAGGLEQESERVSAMAERCIAEGRTTVVYTRRERIDLAGAGAEEQLNAAVRISDAVTSVVTNLKVKPGFIIAKGGITSSNIGTKALKVKKAKAMGQVLPGIPVWMTGEESKFPGMPYVIFPGNVGNDDALANIVRMLTAR